MRPPIPKIVCLAIATTILLGVVTPGAAVESGATETPVESQPITQDTMNAPDPQSPPPRTEAPAEPRFDILEYRVVGNTVLPRGVVERAVYPFLGAAKAFEDVEKARAALEQAFRDAGYGTVFVDIPEQRVAGGTILLNVVEGEISKVLVKGSRYHSIARIRAHVPALAPGAVLHMPALQAQLAELNRGSADRQVTPVFRAGTTPGTVEVDLRVRDAAPLHANLEINNRYTTSTEHLRVAAGLRYDNLWQREHSLGLNYQTAPQDTDQVEVVSANYVLKTHSARDVWVFYGLSSDSEVASVGDVNVIGAGEIFGVRRIHSLRAAAQFVDSLAFGFDAKRFDESVLFGADSFSTPIRYYPFSLGYTGIRPGARGTTNLGVTLNFSVRALSERQVDCGGFPSDQFECKRAGARPNYVYLHGEAQRNHVFESGWELNARAEARVASQPLISNEQFSAGGIDSVRGYLEAEELGDEGLVGSVEARTPASRFKFAGSGEIYGLSFLDGATLRLKDPLPDQRSHFRMSGVGIGIRLAAKHARAELHWAYPLQDASSTQKGDDRLHFKTEFLF